MTLNVISNFAANNALRNLGVNGNEATKSVAKLSSGSRVTSAADDAAALAIGTRVNTEVKSLEQAAVNAGQAAALLQIADGGLSRAQELLTRMKVLAVQAGADNITNAERALLDTEFQNLKEEIGRLSRDTKFNGQSIIATDFFVGADANLTAADTNGNIGLGGLDGLNEGAGNTNGVVDFAVRGIDNRAQTLGGNGAFILTIYQGDVTISPETGASSGLAGTFIANSFTATPAGFPGPTTTATTQVIEIVAPGPPVVTAATTNSAGVVPSFAASAFNQSEARTSAFTEFNPVAFGLDGALDYNSLRTDGLRTIAQTTASVQYSVTVGAPNVTMGATATTTVTTASYEQTTFGLGATPITIENLDVTGATPATVGEDLIFTAFFEFGDLDGDGQNDVIIKRATLDGGLLVDAGDPTADDVTLLTGVTLDFNNANADFSSAGGISEQTQRNAGISIVIDPNLAGADFNLGRDAGGDVQGLFADAVANTNRFAQATVEAFTGGVGSGVTDFDFKVGTGIIADEDEIEITLGGLTLDQLGVENAQIGTKSAADASNTAVSVALDYLVQLRSDVGASINRLEIASDNVAISLENLEASRSRLLDLSVAEEITAFTSKQLLLQSGTSVLAQANQLPQNLLRLYA